MVPTVTFATACWERDWRLLLLDPNYLTQNQIKNHCFPFSETILIINNVNDIQQVLTFAPHKVTRPIIAHDVFPFFHLDKSEFNEWQYYNALAPLNAIYHCKTDYLLYLTGDVYLPNPVNWIPQAILFMEKNRNV